MHQRGILCKKLYLIIYLNKLVFWSGFMKRIENAVIKEGLEKATICQSSHTKIAVSAMWIKITHHGEKGETLMRSLIKNDLVLIKKKRINGFWSNSNYVETYLFQRYSSFHVKIHIGCKFICLASNQSYIGKIELNAFARTQWYMLEMIVIV